jgi:hypothetical protein
MAVKIMCSSSQATFEEVSNMRSSCGYAAWIMGSRRQWPRRENRRLQSASISGITSGFVTGSRRDLCGNEAAAIAAIHTVSTDPDLLAEVAAEIAVHGDPFPDRAERSVALLVKAGADEAAIERHAAVIRACPTHELRFTDPPRPPGPRWIRPEDR